VAQVCRLCVDAELQRQLQQALCSLCILGLVPLALLPLLLAVVWLRPPSLLVVRVL
jgi:hypothetical protein